MLPIQQKLTPYNYSAMSSKTNLYIVIHYVGAVSSAKDNALYFYNNDLRGTGRESSAHYFVDETSIWQSVKDTDRAWHCGDSKKYGQSFYGICTNFNSIGIEMCCKKTKSGEWYFEDKTVDNTVELVKYLMNKYNIPIDRVIRHYDVTGKLCPQPYINNVEWMRFKDKIMGEGELSMTQYEELKAEIEKLKQSQEKVYHYWKELPEYAHDIIRELYDRGIYKGAGSADLNLPESLMRSIVINYRAGVYDK